MAPDPRLLVVADQPLVGESVRAALTSRGFQPVLMRWPSGVPAPRGPTDPESYEAGLLLCDLERPGQREVARALIGRVRVRWVVLTEAPPGPLWGAVLEAGAFTVLPADVPLDRVDQVLRDAVHGTGAMPEEESRRLQDQWARLRAEQERFARLTPREREVLTLLHQGRTVAEIARRLGVAPATVRSQVRSILRKLGVRSQLAAVAAFDALPPATRRWNGSSARPGWRHGATT